MAQDLVIVRLKGEDVPVGRAFAKAKGLDILDEPTTNPDGTRRSRTRASGRPTKPRASVAKKAAEKKEKAAVIEPAPTDEEQSR